MRILFFARSIIWPRSPSGSVEPVRLHLLLGLWAFNYALGKQLLAIVLK